VIALIDYRAGNLTSVRKALAAEGAEFFTPDSPADLASARGVIVPGVGHFTATRALDDDWIETIRHLVSDGRPLLGICLGMQWLYEGSEEAADVPGLGMLAGRCYRLGKGGTVKIPHVGWNTVELGDKGALIEGVPNHSQVYFTHSYVAPITADTVGATEHGEPFASIVERGPVAGVQFHPEKSGDVGLRILRNWLRRVR
jgi:glutamine amidotransferase